MGGQDQEKVDFAFEIVSRKHAFLNDAIAAMQSKIATIIGFIATVLAGIVVLQQETQTLGPNLFTAGIAGLYVALWFLIIAARPGNLWDPVDFETIYSSEAFRKPAIDIKNQVVADMIKTYGLNLSIHKGRARLYSYSLWILGTSILLVMTGIFGRAPKTPVLGDAKTIQIEKGINHEQKEKKGAAN
jgi:hypothetical protein